MELSGFVFVALLNFIPFGCSKLVDFCQLPYCGTDNLACNNPSDLARLAVITCSTHKFCLNSPEFYYVGTNIGSNYYLGNLNDYEDLELMLRIIQDWTRYADYINIKMGLYMPTTLEKSGIPNALLLMADRNTHVGCSAMRFTVNSIHNFVFLCAFSTDLFVERPIYRMSMRPGTACNRLDQTYSALCAVGENYDNNKPVLNARVFQLPLNLSMGRQAYVPAT
ncbi:GM25763 [Drosophila sechellia]|uniref:GM25763 n=1 Tax=Drosophila sechellia TaxID=7238 RepID=B4HLZ1_DROSE|nr:GM25763 [Drosophila sechellia]